MSSIINQLRRRRADLGFTLTTLEKRTGFALSRLSVIFNRQKVIDLRLSSVEVLAEALDAEVIVVPKASVSLVRLLLSSGTLFTSVEDTPSALERALSDKT
jgi:transcriptional regulator with XRE-family HTH domain